MRKFTRNIQKIQNTRLGRAATIRDFLEEIKQKSDQHNPKNIIIPSERKPDESFFNLNPKFIEINKLSFEISAEDIVKIFKELVEFTNDPTKICNALQELNQELGERLSHHNIQFGENDLPKFLIAGEGHFIPGPPPDEYRPKKKGRLLDALLLEREKKNGLNTEGFSPKFVGPINKEEANPFVATGHIFTESTQVSRLLLHGSLSHRIIFDAICCAMNAGELNFSFGSNQKLSTLQLVELLVSVNHYQRFQDILLKKSPISLWELSIDTVADSSYALPIPENFFDPDGYSFSPRSPFVLNSILLCFGSEFQLSHLQYYLLDSHWKAAYKMVHRIKLAMRQDDFSDSEIYQRCMEALTTHSGSLGEIGVNFPFTLSDLNAQQNPSYTPFDSQHPVKGIVKKVGPQKSMGEYASWGAFFQQLPGSVQNKTKYLEKPTPSYLPSVINNNPTETYYDFKFKLSQVDKEKQSEFLRKYSEKLEGFLEYRCQLEDILQVLSKDAQQYLLSQLSDQKLQTLLTSSFDLSALIEALDSSLHTNLIDLLGIDRIIGFYKALFDITYHFSNNASSKKTEFLRILVEKEPLILLKIEKNNKDQAYSLLEDFSGYYQESTLEEFLKELASLFGYKSDAIIQLASELNSFTLKYDSHGWMLINVNSNPPITQTVVSEEIAGALFSALGKGKEKFKLLITIETQQRHSLIQNEDLQQKIADIINKQTTRSAQNLNKGEMRCLFQLAADKSQTNICETLINSGLNLFLEVSDISIEDDRIFNRLCETQARYNIEKLKQKIERTDWGTKVGGSMIQTDFGPKKVPRTVATEWRLINEAKQGIQTYYQAWDQSIKACKSSQNQNSFFRKPPAIQHYIDVGEQKILPQRSAAL